MENRIDNITPKNAHNVCPKMDGCNAATCPLQRAGKHLADEGICFYAREFVKGGSATRFKRNLLSGLYRDIGESLEWLKGESADIRKRLDKAAQTPSRFNNA